METPTQLGFCNIQISEVALHLLLDTGLIKGCDNCYAYDVSESMRGVGSADHPSGGLTVCEECAKR